MDAKTVYLSNGKPFLVMKNSENEFIYPDAKYTEIEPPKDLYFTEEYPCLLYTSPSPRDGLLSRMPSSA